MVAQVQFADAEVLSVDGTPTKVATFWKDGPVVLVFLRHFG
jgi:hypothetical protein